MAKMQVKNEKQNSLQGSIMCVFTVLKHSFRTDFIVVIHLFASRAGYHLKKYDTNTSTITLKVLLIEYIFWYPFTYKSLPKEIFFSIKSKLNLNTQKMSNLAS